MDNVYVRLGKRLRAERLRQGLTQELLAERAHLSTAFIGQIERGENAASLASLEKISRGLGVPLAALFGGNDRTDRIVYRAPLPAHGRLLALLRERPAREQEYIVDTVKTLLRRLKNVGRNPKGRK